MQSAGEGSLDAASDGPSEWVVREMFRLDEQADGTVLVRHHSSPGNENLGGLQADLTLGAQPVPFEVDLLVDGAAQAAAAAATADAAIVVLGNHPLVNGRETEDRADLTLPHAQENLLREVYAANSSTALLLVSSYPYAVGWAEVHLPAVLWSSHGGQELGRAVADVLTGATDPGGRLAQTWYRSACELPDIFDYDIIANDATYLYHRGTPLYPFGHGLSYTTFDYSDLRLSAGEGLPEPPPGALARAARSSVRVQSEFSQSPVRVQSVDAAAGETVTATFTVTNSGARPGTEVVQLYSHQQRSRVKQPLRQLRAFTKLSLAPGESRTVSLGVRVDDLAFWDVTTGRMVVEAARHKIMVGRSSADIRLTATLAVRGTVIGTRRAVERPVQAADNDEYSGVALTDGGVKAVEDGAWLCFQGVDLSGVRTAHVLGHGASVALRIDDPFSGPRLATLVPGQTTPAATVDGVHDLYLVFGSVGTTVKELAFTR